MKTDNKIRILHSFLESLPFLKTGGCADVIGAIAKHIDKSRFDCRVIMPDFVFNRNNIQQAELITETDVKFGGRRYKIEIRSDNAYGAVFYFLRCDEMFSNKVIFTQDEEQLTRYRFYQYAVLEAVKHLGFRPDIIHGHDWESSLLCKLIKEPEYCGYFRNTKTIQCIHNIIWQGDGDLGIGIENADAVLTVSDTYRQEILTPEYGAGLDNILRQRQETLYAIKNGVDFDEFNPEKDGFIAEPYDCPEGKKANKLHLQRSQGLEENENSFVIGMVTRLYSYKGMDLILEAFEGIMDIPGVQLALLGDGPENFEPEYEALAARYPGRVAAMTYFDSGSIMRSVYAGSDAYLMPSKTEPCGISQMIAMRYGTVPIVRSTGGLKDTVVPYGNEECTGFAFEEYDASEMLNAIRNAEQIYRFDKKQWNEIAARAMKTDNSWDIKVKEYEKLYIMLSENSLICNRICL